jgi:hypothetical protein
MNVNCDVSVKNAWSFGLNTCIKGLGFKYKDNFTGTFSIKTINRTFSVEDFITVSG